MLCSLDACICTGACAASRRGPHSPPRLRPHQLPPLPLRLEHSQMPNEQAVHGIETEDGDTAVLSYAPLDPAAIEASCRSTKDGAVVSFVCLVARTGMTARPVPEYNMLTLDATRSATRVTSFKVRRGNLSDLFETALLTRPHRPDRHPPDVRVVRTPRAADAAADPRRGAGSAASAAHRLPRPRGSTTMLRARRTEPRSSAPARPHRSPREEEDRRRRSFSDPDSAPPRRVAALDSVHLHFGRVAAPARGLLRLRMGPRSCQAQGTSLEARVVRVRDDRGGEFCRQGW